MIISVNRKYKKYSIERICKKLITKQINRLFLDRYSTVYVEAGKLNISLILLHILL